MRRRRRRGGARAPRESPVRAGGWSRRGTPVEVYEQDRQVGGLARTVEHNGFRFDIGGHRFFSKVDVVNELWHQVLGADLLTRRRLSRIYFRGRFLRYPLRPLDV